MKPEHADVEDFVRRVRIACGGIGSEYFQLPIAGADAVYRERVYCYELYHQLRSEWGKFPYSLGGEVDKSGHPYFRDGPYSASKPDFLVHEPRHMSRNLAVLEVKSRNTDKPDLLRDIEKLSWYCSQANYASGLMLIYGAAPTGHFCLKEVLAAARDHFHQGIFFLLAHFQSGEEASVVGIYPQADASPQSSV